MDHYIAFPINGEFNQQYQATLKAVSDRLRKPGILVRPKVPHITIKSTFHRGNIEDIQSMLDSIVKGRNPINITVNGYGHFDKRNIHYQVDPSEELDSFQRELSKELIKLGGINFTQADYKRNYHITLMNTRDIGMIFHPAMGCLKRIKTTPQIVTLDTLALVTRPNGHTHKVSNYTFSP